MSSEHPDLTSRMAFDDARLNFVAAARLGLATHFTWLDGEHIPAQELVCERLIPLARRGLASAAVDSKDAEHYLGIIHHRVESGRTGAVWMLGSYEAMRSEGRPGERLNALVAAILDRQKGGAPVSTWEPARLEESGGFTQNFMRVEHYMTTELFTVREDEPIDLVASIMDWRHVRHVPVEDNDGHLVGIVSYRTLLHLIAGGWRGGGDSPVAVADVMKRDPISIPPETTTLEAVTLMRKQKISALPVVKDGRLVGIVSERDVMEITAELLELRISEL
jgi:CBS domain-containing protein